jgi:hypothetical protein
MLWLGGLTCIGVPLSTMGRLDVRISLAAWTITTVIIYLDCLAMFVVPVLCLCASRFEFYLIAAHGMAVAVCGYAVFTDRTVGALWAGWFWNTTFAMVSFDSMLRVSWTTKYTYMIVLGAKIAFLCGFFFDAMQVGEVEITVFGKQVSLNERVRASLVVLAVYIARGLFTSRSSLGAYLILRGFRPVKVTQKTAELLVVAQSLPARQALVAKSESAATASAVAPSPAPPACGICDAARAALQEAGGDSAVAGAALLGAVDQLVGDRERSWVRAAEELRAREEVRGEGRAAEELRAREEVHGEGSRSAESRVVRLIIPSFLPVAIDPSRSVAAALGGARLHALSHALLSTRLVPALALALAPLSMLVFLYELAARDFAPRSVLHVGLALATACGALQALTLNTLLMRDVVMPRFNVAWALVNLWLVGAAGAMVFDSAQDGATWLVLHLLLTTHVVQDAAPTSARLRRVTAFAIAASAIAQTSAVFVMWLCVDASPGAFIDFFGHHIQLKQLCFAAQVNGAIVVLRAAYRALTDVRNLFYVDGLLRVSLPEPELRELHEVMLAVQQQAPTQEPPSPKQHAPLPHGDVGGTKTGAGEAAQEPPPP